MIDYCYLGTNFWQDSETKCFVYTNTTKNQNSQTCAKMKIKLNFKNFIIKIKPKETAIMADSNPKADPLLSGEMNTF